MMPHLHPQTQLQFVLLNVYKIFKKCGMEYCIIYSNPFGVEINKKEGV